MLLRSFLRLRGLAISLFGSTVRRLAQKVLALSALFCITAAPVLAVPETPIVMLVTLSELKNDIRFAYLSSSVGHDFKGWRKNLLLFFAGKMDEPRVNRIEIFPGTGTTIRQGEPMNFIAIGYTTNGTPASGVKFEWSLQNEEGNSRARNLPNGVFEARKAGNFRVEARAGGISSQVNVTVEPNRALIALRRIKEAEANGRPEEADRLKRQGRYSTENIDSKKDYKDRTRTISKAEPLEEQEHPGPAGKRREHGPNAGDTEPKYETSNINSKARMMIRPLLEDGWNNDNWWMADDPGNQTGDSGGTSPEGAGNGNFQLSAPVVALPGRGIDLSLSLNYNSRVWSKAGNVMSFDAERGFPAPGWNLGFGKMMFMGTSGGCMLIDADGTNRGYTGTITNYSSSNYTSTTFNGHTTDGSFIDYNCYVSVYNGVASMGGESRLPNGTKIQFYAPSANGKQAYPTTIADAQGNYIWISYRNFRGPSIQSITDTMGRVVTFNYDSLDRLISVDVPKMNNQGVRTAVRLHYKQIALNPGFAYPLTPDTNNSYPYVIDAIYYPGTATGYWFGADPIAPDYGTYYSSYGMLAKVIEQRGMNWTGSAGHQGTVDAGTMTKQAVYNYDLSPNYLLTDAPTYTNLTESWEGMDTSPALSCSGASTNAAVTCYAVNMNASPRTITVTQPNGAKSKQLMYNASGQWYDGLIYQDQTLDPANNDAQLSKSVVTWAQGHYSSPRPSQTEITDEKGQTLRTTYTYGTAYNQLTSKKEYDYDGTTPLRETRNTYENNAAYTSRHIFNLVKSTEIYDGPGNRIAKTDFEYDNNALINPWNHNLKEAPGVTMHYSTYDPYTTDTQDGACISGEWNHYACSYEGEWIPEGEMWLICTFTCYEYEQVSVYDPNTVYRGNLTKTTVYTDAATATPAVAISQTKQYDVTGNLVAESASCCELTTYSYTAATQYAYPTTLTRGSSDPNSPLKNTSTAVYDVYTGLVTSATDPNGRTSVTTYDPNTLRPTVSTSSTGAYSQTVYDDLAMTITEEVFESTTGGPVTAGKTKKYLNGIGQVKKAESFAPNSVIDIVDTKYTALGQVWKQSRPYRTGDQVFWSEKFYDLQGRLVKIVEPDLSETKAFYNEALYPDSALVGGNPTPGNTIRVSDPWGRERWGKYDALGSLVEVVEPNPDQSLNPTGRLFDQGVRINGSLITKYTYDRLGRLTQSDQGGQFRKFKYDSLGRLTRQKLAEQTATLNDDGDYVGAGQPGAYWANAFVYDNRSNLTKKTDARGVMTNFSYKIGGADDPLNRLQSVSYDLGGLRDMSKPISPAPTVSYEYMTTGDQDRVKKVTAAGVNTEELAYDGEARVTDFTKTMLNRSGYPLLTSYTYDTLSRVTSTRHPKQWGLAGGPRKLVENTFDTASRLKEMTVGGHLAVSVIDYNASGQTKSIKIGQGGTNQVTEEYTFDPQTGLLTRQKAIRNGSDLLDLSYSYNRENSVGSLNGKTGHLTKVLNNLDHNKDREYEFDALGRLTKAKGGTNSLWTQTYSYDRFGNRTSVAATGVSADVGSTLMHTDGIPNLTFSTENNNRITTSNVSGQFEYDVAGNQTRALAEDGLTWRRFEYDAANRLVNITQDNGTPIQSQQFGVGNDRLSLTDHVLGKTTWYGGSVEYAETGGNGVLSWSKSCVYLGDSLLSTITPDEEGGENVDYNHPDRLGTRLVTNQDGGTPEEQAHLPFGTALNAESTITTNPKRFTSYERSAQTGLDYAMNRTYDSKQGRFTQVDPIGMQSVSLAAPQTLNLYAYCVNDPVNYVDPSGLFLGRFFRWLGNLISSLFRSGIAKRIAVKFIVSLVVSRGNFGVAIRSVIPDILRQLGLPNFAITPSWNPNLRYPISLGGIGSLSQYIIQNFLSGARNSFPCPPNINQLLGRFKNLIAKLLENESGHLTDSPLENGGWIYQRKNGDLFFLRVEKFGGAWRRQSASVDFSNPPNIKGARVVGRAHTHPYPRAVQDILNLAGGAGGGPSEDDRLNSELGKIPVIVAHQIGVQDGKPLFSIQAASNVVWTIEDKNCR